MSRFHLGPGEATGTAGVVISGGEAFHGVLLIVVVSVNGEAVSISFQVLATDKKFQIF